MELESSELQMHNDSLLKDKKDLEKQLKFVSANQKHNNQGMHKFFPVFVTVTFARQSFSYSIVVY